MKRPLVDPRNHQNPNFILKARKTLLVYKQFVIRRPLGSIPVVFFSKIFSSPCLILFLLSELDIYDLAKNKDNSCMRSADAEKQLARTSIKGQCHEDFAVLSQFRAKIITLRL